MPRHVTTLCASMACKGIALPLLLLFEAIMSDTYSLSTKCGAGCRWVTNCLISRDCDYWFHLKCKHHPQHTRQEDVMVLWPMYVPETCEATKNQAPGNGIKSS